MNPSRKFRSRIFLIICAVLFLFTIGLIFIPNQAKEYTASFVWEKYQAEWFPHLVRSSDAKLFYSIGLYFSNNTSPDYDIEKAKRALLRSYALDEKNFDVVYKLALVFFIEKNFDESKKFVEEALLLNPTNLRPHYILGLVETYAGNFLEAADAFKKMIEWVPDEWAPYNDLAWVYLQDAKYENARDIALGGLSRTDSKNIWLLNNLGVAYLQLNEYKKALGAFDEVSNNFDIYTVDDWLLAYPSNNVSEVELLRTEFRGLIHFNTYEVARLLGDMDRAEEEKKKAKEFIPPYNPLWEELSRS